MKIERLLLILGWLIVVSSCSTIKPEAPAENYPEFSVKPPLSIINVPFELDIRKLETMFNNEFRGAIYSDTSFTNNGNDNLKLTAYKRENIRFSLNGNELSYRVPLLVMIKYKYSVGAFGFSVTDVKEASGSVVLKFKTKLSINRDWTITSYTVSDGYEWISTPSVKVGSVSIPLPVISDVLLESNLGMINREIDASIKSSIDLKKLAGEAWRGIQQPIGISADPPLWLLVTPQEASTVPIQGTGNMLRQLMGVRVAAELYYGAKPDQEVNPVLPPLKVTSRMDDGFRVSLLTDLPFADINEIARKQLAGYTFTEGRYKLKIEDLSLYGNGEQLVVAAQVSGSINGTIYLAGTPWFDKSTSTLKIRDLDFDLKTNNALIKSASWLLRGTIASQISEKCTFPAGDLIEQARLQLHNFLSTGYRYEYITISGSLNNIDIDRIAITRSSVKILVTFSGKLSLGLSEE